MCFYMVDRKRIELLPLTCKASVLPLSLTAHITDYLSHCTPSVKARFGAPEETRTPKIWLLRPTRIPIPSPGHVYNRVVFCVFNYKLNAFLVAEPTLKLIWCDNALVTYIVIHSLASTQTPKLGSPGWDRTTDILINSQAQLPLCYWGIKLDAGSGNAPLSVWLMRPSGSLDLPATNLVSVARIELALHAPKARVIPFHYTEKKMERPLRFPRR